jgi:osmotically-inducible protein OsmY
VQQERHREKAEKVTKKVKGVKSVQNKLRVSPV